MVDSVWLSELCVLIRSVLVCGLSTLSPTARMPDWIRTKLLHDNYVWAVCNGHQYINNLYIHIYIPLHYENIEFDSINV